jgi:7-cyano-7-deazaguanine synthase in queuosine biosynthesis
MAEIVQHNVLCNGAKLPTGVLAETTPLQLDYRHGQHQNIRIELPDFIQSVFHLPGRILDLLELAAYVYCADRSVTRGPKEAVEYHKWSRSFHFHIKVRDFEFWKQSHIIRMLDETLNFLSGDREFKFTFQPGHRTPPASLFDREEFTIQASANTKILLFSGGLDSLAGVAELLANSTDNLCLVSHRSGQPGTARTQDQLFKALIAASPNRIHHYKFHCGLTGVRAAEETQRTRMFLYSSIAASLCAALSQQKLFIFENGITSLNFARRQDLLNARATRTTHPKTIHLFEQLFSEVSNRKLTIETPFFWKTKADVLDNLGKSNLRDLIPSAVSCSKTFLNLEQASHCGGCSQCIDRRLAAYAAGVAEIDETGIYAFDFVNQTIADGEVRTTLLDYIRQARDFAEWNPDHFCRELLSELAEIVGFISAKTEEEAYTNIWELCKRHGTQVMEALVRIRNKHDKLARKIPEGSLLKLIAEREYLKTPVSRLIENICARLRAAIPIAFQKNHPKDESDFNDKVSAILNTERNNFEREHPAIRFGLATVIPDHSWHEQHLLIEAKFIRNSTSPSKASEGIAADLIKYPSEVHVLFVVYDPNRAIPNDDKFRSEFEKKRPCTVFIIR